MTAVTAANGSARSLAITGGEGYFAGPNYMLAGIKPSRVSWWVRIAESVDGGEGYFVLSTSPDVESLIYVFISGNAFNFIGNPGFYVSATPEPDRWYHFDVAIDWEQETYSVAIDGTAVGEDSFSAQGAAFNGIWRLDIFNAYAPDGVVYYDEIVMMP